MGAFVGDWIVLAVMGASLLLWSIADWFVQADERRRWAKHVAERDTQKQKRKRSPEQRKMSAAIARARKQGRLADTSAVLN